MAVSGSSREEIEARLHGLSYRQRTLEAATFTLAGPPSNYVVHLTLTAKIPGADKAKFEELAGMAKAGCPVSKLLNTKITLDATLL